MREPVTTISSTDSAEFGSAAVWAWAISGVAVNRSTSAEAPVR
jgi:hypothetical protein